MEKLYEVNNNVQNNVEFANLVDHLCTLGGQNVKDCVHQMMKALMMHQVSLNITWMGQKKEKEGWSRLLLQDALINAIQKNPRTGHATEADCDVEAKKWLQNAPDRYGGRAKREQAKSST
ncbi:hypothetical protein HELRODRAFT_169381 [Helobdella robusta]|uniref:DUF4806 domain-containing protein n=1 Tax=Helobdella robusta TaxID=6412 RepID=T1F1V6_HELRO|nr:hypothetical protein HELRODRAFT_169381 [Helobdella robusta]ESO08520.1 hypothetical protein HELRODRAFT_169381 [Helobdella robusta]